MERSQVGMPPASMYIQPQHLRRRP
jgi:hypothetical protein